LYEAYTNVALRIDVGLDDTHFDPARHGFPTVIPSPEVPASAGGDSR
jgi:hypothetical protein